MWATYVPRDVYVSAKELGKPQTADVTPEPGRAGSEPPPLERPSAVRYEGTMRVVDLREAWTLAHEELAPDGALRDIYVHETDLADWLDTVSRHFEEVSFFENGEVQRLPAQLALHHFSGGERWANLHFKAGSVALSAYCFTPDEIELSFEPTDVGGPKELGVVLDLMRLLGRALRKRVDLTMENLPDDPIFRYDPSGDAVDYMPPKV